MHHAIWVEHDGSWTWSIEEGKAFEDDHKVLERKDGFPTRGDAKDAMMTVWARLIDEGKKPGRLKAATKSPPDHKSTLAVKKAAAAAAKSADGSFAPELPSWAVILDGQIVALFRDKKSADGYVSVARFDEAVVRQIQFGAVEK